MTKIWIASLVVSIALTAGASFAAPAAEDGARQAFAQLDKCIANSDAKCVGEVMADDATFSEPMAEAKVIKGKAQIVKTLETLMGGTNNKGAKPTHVVDNVRPVGTDYAIVDSTVQFAGMKAEGDGARHTLHTLAVVGLKGDKWLIEDLRNYIVGPAWSPPKNETAQPAKNDAATAGKESPPAAKDATPPAKDATPPAKDAAPAAKEPAPAAAH